MRTPKVIFFSVCCMLCTALSGWAQGTQTIRGTVVLTETKYPLEFVNVAVEAADGEIIAVATTDIEGAYMLEDIPLGRKTLKFTYIGYKPVVQNNVIVNAGREVILDVEMEEDVVQITGVEVVAKQDVETNNVMATVSARSFRIEDTERYAGSRGDPPRMASNYAGVQGADDSRNDIVIRGNTPQGLIWRFEGVTIPNPNHFSIAGTSGGPVTILNNKYLANSDFFTGAFPAEYANGIAGVFDLRMRNGNNRRHEMSTQFGFLGTELFAEGPIDKEKKSSYLASYRYSTLRLFEFMNIRIGTDAVPRYQDGAFRINFPRKNGGNLAFWGLGGDSRIDIIISNQAGPDETLLYGENDKDQYFRTRMGAVGMTFKQPLDRNTFFKFTLAGTHSRIRTQHNQIYRHTEEENGMEIFVVDSLIPQLDYTFSENKLAGYFGFVKNFDNGPTLHMGLNADYFDLNYYDEGRTYIQTPEPVENPALGPWMVRWDANVNPFMIQPYIQLKQQLGPRFTVTGGLTSLYYSINDNSWSPIEPRAGIAYQSPKGHRLAFSYGLHSQAMPNYLYFYGEEAINGDPIEQNLDIGLFRSHHFILGYEQRLAKAMRMKTEVYYQYLFDIPVDEEPSSFSIVNTGSGFTRFFPTAMVNAGNAYNYGIELTLEKAFTRGYYFMFTGSLFDSKYQGSDEVWRNTTFNGNFAVNLLAAREFVLNQKLTLNIGGNLTTAGGRWYGEVDVVESARNLEVTFTDESMNTLQFEPYFRADLKVNLRWNTATVTHEFGLDMVNVTNRRNILTLTYVHDEENLEDKIQEQYQLGLLPIFFYRLDFSLGAKN